MDSQKKEADLGRKLLMKENEVSSLSTRLRLSEKQAQEEKKNFQDRLKECKEQLTSSEEQHKQAVSYSENITGLFIALFFLYY